MDVSGGIHAKLDAGNPCRHDKISFFIFCKREPVVAITPWALLSPDIQIVKGAQKDQHTIGQGPGPFGVPFIAGKQSIGTNTVLGLRFKVEF